MKKVGFLLIGVFVLLSAGCGKASKQELVCTSKVANVNQKYSIVVEDKKIKDTSLEIDYDLSNYNETLFEQYKQYLSCDNITSSFKVLKDCKSDIKDKKYTFSGKLDLEKLLGDSVNEEVNIEDAKKTFESMQDMTCIIK